MPIFIEFLFLLQNDDASVPSEKVTNKAVSGTDCFDGVDPSEPQSSIGTAISDAEQGKTPGDITSEKDPIEAAIETGGSATTGPENSPPAEPSDAVDAGSPALPTATQPTVFVVSDCSTAPAAADVLADDTSMSIGDDDEDTESDSLGKENDHSSAATGLGKNP